MSSKMSIEKEKNDLKTKRLEEFIVDHDLHLLSDSTEAVSVGSIYKRDPPEPKARRIGDVTNFIMPTIAIPQSKKGSQQDITENFRNKRSLGLVAKFVGKFISSIGFSIDSTKEQILEVNYDKVEYEELRSSYFWG